MTIETPAQRLQKLSAQSSWFSVETLRETFGASYSKRQLLRILEPLTRQTLKSLDEVRDGLGRPLNRNSLPEMKRWLAKTRKSPRTLHFLRRDSLLALSDLRGRSFFRHVESLGESEVIQALEEINDPLVIIPHLEIHRVLSRRNYVGPHEILTAAHFPLEFSPRTETKSLIPLPEYLRELENESIEIIRVATTAARKPAMLFSMGKDSMAMLRLAEKAFAPESVPFPLVMIDTRWKFQEMYAFRAWIEGRKDLHVIVHINPEAISQDINPFDFGSAVHTDITKTQALRQVLDEYGFDFVFGGARRDEEKSRAKERVFSVRDANHAWDPRNQRPEFWNSYNTELTDGQSMRVFPLSNWTELDIWRYIEAESLPVVPLYFAKRRAFVQRNGALIALDDERFPLQPGEETYFEQIRFRTLGCYPLTGGVRSTADNISKVIEELESSTLSERSSRVIDFDPGASMEQKKREGYF